MFYLFLVRNTVSVVKFTCVWLVECCFNHIFGVQFMLFCVAVGVCVKVTSCYLSNFYSFRITDPTSETGDNQLLPDS